MKHLPLILAALFVIGCGHNVLLVETQNGIERSRTEGTIGVFSTELALTESQQVMPTCEASIGSMDSREEHQICIEQVRRDKRRRARQLDWQGYPYGYPPSAYAVQP